MRHNEYTLQEHGAIHDFLSKAYRRQIALLAAEQGVAAVCLVMGGAILLLIAGTQLFDGRWLWALAAAGLAMGVWRLRRGLPSRYEVAQGVDRRMGWPDAVSTACYFSGAQGWWDPRAVELQRDQAERMVRGADVAAAVPFEAPRSLTWLGGLVLVALSLVGLRYGLLKTLDLDQPLAKVEWGYDRVPENVAAKKKSLIQERFEEQLQQMGLSLEDLNEPVSEHPNMEMAEPVLSEQGSSTPTPGAEGKQVSNPKGDGQGNQQDDSTEGPEKASGGEGKETDGADEGGNPQTGKPENPKGNSPKNANQGEKGNENSSLLDKMRDAMSNLMSKLKQPTGGEQQSQKGQGPEDSQSGKGQQASTKKGTQGKNQQKGEGQQGQPNGDEADANQPVESAQGKPGDRSADKAGSPDPKSGVGKQDGSKDLQDAEQLAAMGKISEILGKRAQQINGEMTVEVSSGKQQLKTSYTDKRSIHLDSGAETHRDEIPLEYQSYVQKYFEEVRKGEKTVGAGAKKGL